MNGELALAVSALARRWAEVDFPEPGIPTRATRKGLQLPVARVDDAINHRSTINSAAFGSHVVSGTKAVVCDIFSSVEKSGSDSGSDSDSDGDSERKELTVIGSNNTWQIFRRSMILISII